LNPTTMALEAAASITSLSVMAPTEVWSTLTVTCSVASRSQRLAQRLHRTLHVALEDEAEFLHLALLDLLVQRVQGHAGLVGRHLLPPLASPGGPGRSGGPCARRPPPRRCRRASGTPDSPRISTGVAGPASWTFLPRSLIMARTRPWCRPATTASPTRSEPACTRIVRHGAPALVPARPR